MQQYYLGPKGVNNNYKLVAGVYNVEIGFKKRFFLARPDLYSIWLLSLEKVSKVFGLNFFNQGHLLFPNLGAQPAVEHGGCIP